MNRDFSMPQQKKSNIIRYTLRGSDNGYHTKQKSPFQWAVKHDELCPIGSMYAYNIYHQYTPVMLAYIPAPWILWVLYPFISHHHSSDFCIFLSSHPSCSHDEFSDQAAQLFAKLPSPCRPRDSFPSCRAPAK